MLARIVPAIVLVSIVFNTFATFGAGDSPVPPGRFLGVDVSVLDSASLGKNVAPCAIPRGQMGVWGANSSCSNDSSSCSGTSSTSSSTSTTYQYY